MISYRETHIAIKDLLLQRFDIEDKGTEMVWNGPLLTASEILVVNFNIPDRLTQSYIEHEIDQNRDVLDIIIGIALQLGIERGLNMAKEERDKENQLLQILLKYDLMMI